MTFINELGEIWSQAIRPTIPYNGFLYSNPNDLLCDRIFVTRSLLYVEHCNYNKTEDDLRGQKDHCTTRIDNILGDLLDPEIPYLIETRELP